MKPNRFSFSISSAFAAMIVVASLLGFARTWGVVGVALWCLSLGVLLLLRGVYRRKRENIIGSVVLIAIAVLLPAYQPAVLDGITQLPVQVVIVDAASHTPIPNASVRLRRIVGTYSPSPSYAPSTDISAKGTTDRNGAVSLLHAFPSVTRRTGLITFKKVCVPDDLWLEVWREDYQPVILPLAKFTGTFRSHGDLRFPRVQIEIHSVSPTPKDALRVAVRQCN